MSQSKDHVGFSFQLSETPPPVRGDGARTPLGDLDLDLGDFGDLAEPSPLPEDLYPAASQAPEPDVIAPETQVVAHETQVVAHETPATAAEPDVPPVEKATASEPPVIAPESRAIAPERDERPIAQGSRPNAAGPTIKKIQFPQAEKRSSAGPANKSSRPKTHFSPSVAPSATRSPLDSDPDELAPPERAPARESDLAPPEDLPDTPALATPGEPGGWGTDTPSAREIWQKARASWRSTSRQALALGGQGFRAGQQLAEHVNDKVREQLKKSAEARRATADTILIEPSQETVQGTEHAAPVRPSKSTSPSMSGRIILGLARSSARRLAAPASAVLVAGMVYFAGTHFLGGDEAIALNKAGPAVPDLGSLRGDEPQDEGEEKPAAQRKEESNSTAKAAPPSSEPAAMQTELVDMPEGMSWPGKGLIEVVTSEDELIYVDGVFTGRGPLRRIPVTPGKHEISIRTEHGERSGTAEVQAGRNSRVVFR